MVDCLKKKKISYVFDLMITYYCYFEYTFENNKRRNENISDKCCNL